MLSKYCCGCQYCRWMVGIGFGIRCKHNENHKYKKEDDKHQNMDVIISNIQTDCEYKIPRSRDGI